MPWSSQTLANPMSKSSSAEKSVYPDTWKLRMCKPAGYFSRLLLCVWEVRIRSSVGGQWVFRPRLRLLDALNVFLKVFEIAVLRTKMVCCWTLANWCMPSGIHLVLFTYRDVLKYGQTELGLSTSLAFCVCVCLVHLRSSNLLSVCQDIRHCAPKPSVGAWICITTGCSFYFNAVTLFSPSMHNPSISPLYWSCILSEILKHSSFLLVYSCPQRPDPGWMPTGTCPALLQLVSC